MYYFTKYHYKDGIDCGNRGGILTFLKRWSFKGLWARRDGWQSITAEHRGCNPARGGGWRREEEEEEESAFVLKKTVATKNGP